MNDTLKLNIQTALKKYCDKKGSQNAAAHSLSGVSSATITQILNNNWELISPEMWQKVAAGIKFNVTNWVIVTTSVFIKSNAYMGDAKRNPDGIRAIVINASMGKSVALESFVNNNPNSYYIRCHRHLGVKHLLREMLKNMGKDSSGTAIEMLDNLVSYLERENQPLFIIDEVDKLKDEVLEMFIDIENKLHNRCGFVFFSTPYLKKRIELGVARNKRGFAELYSRMKKNFWDLNPSKKEFIRDAKDICQANGVDNEDTIIELTNKCDNDFRVLRDLIVAQKNK
ncbi:MAG: ATP-binding protein [Bacteroidetes bacterium]|nr:ATP-binding protein [Bacteroidota bacterium]